MLSVLAVHAYVLLMLIPQTHEIMQTHARCYDEPYGCGSMVHGGEENLEPIGKDAKDILYHATCP